MALVGFMGAGKSAVGRALAAVLGRPFIDIDELIVAQEGPIGDIFEKRGEAAFRAAERDVTVGAVSRGLDEPAVLALGGGAVLSDDVREALRRLPDVVWLTAPAEVLWERVRRAGQGRRPLARDEAAFGELLASRTELYHAVATLVVDNDGSRSPGDMAAEIAARVSGRPVVAGDAVSNAKDGG